MITVRKAAGVAALALLILLVSSSSFSAKPVEAMGPPSSSCSNLYYASSITTFSIVYPGPSYSTKIDIVQHPNATITLPEGSFYDVYVEVQTPTKSVSGNTLAGEVWFSSNANTFTQSGCLSVSSPGDNNIALYELHNCCEPFVGVQHVSFEFLKSGASNQVGATYSTAEYNIDWVPWNVTTTTTVTTAMTTVTTTTARVTTTSTVTSVSTTPAPAVTSTVTSTQSATAPASTSTVTVTAPATTATTTATSTLTETSMSTTSAAVTTVTRTVTSTATTSVTESAATASTDPNSISRDFEYGLGAILAFIIVSVVGVVLLRRQHEAAYKAPSTV
jgi:hypothetical protein